MLKKIILFTFIFQVYSFYGHSNVITCASDLYACEAMGKSASECISTSDACKSVQTPSGWGRPHACSVSCNRFFCARKNAPNAAACQKLAETVVDGKALCPESKVAKCLKAVGELSDEERENSKNLVIGLRVAKEANSAKAKAGKSGFFSGFFK